MLANLLSGLISSLVFLLTFLGLGWNILVSAVLSVGVFASTYLITKPTPKIGDLILSEEEDQKEILEIYRKAKEDILALKDYSNQRLEPDLNKDIYQEIKELSNVGMVILNYLNKNPRLISSSRHFLTYYVNRSRKIVENYEELKNGHFEEDKWKYIEDQTLESLELLSKVFSDQRYDLYADKVLELETENELLEKTVKLGGTDEK